jgi:uncharacterized protein
MTTATITRLSVFPLAGALLFPGLRLPLHIFEPRYRSLVSDAMARDRKIAMIQPRPSSSKAEEARGDGARGDSDRPALFDLGCVGKIDQVEALDDGRYNVILEGLTRFRVIRELDVSTPFRQIEAELLVELVEDDLGIANRAALEQESRRFAEAQGYAVDWDSVSRLDDEALVNGIAQISPFDAAAKQALLEANSLSERSELIIQLMQFFGRHDGDNRVTLQ